MAKRDMKSALKGSLMSEEKAIESRFERAEALLGSKSDELESRETKFLTAHSKNKQDDLKVIRDSFTMPQADYDLIKFLKKRSLQAGFEITKSEIIRAGLHSLNQMDEKEFKARITKVEKIKTGRPKQIK
jgi:hypothetical protein